MCNGGGLRGTGTAVGVDRFAVLPLASLIQCLRASSDNVVIVVAVLASVRLVAQMMAPTPECSLPRSEEVGRCAPWFGAGWRVGFLVWDGSGGAFAAWDLHSDSQWFAWGT